MYVAVLSVYADATPGSISQYQEFVISYAIFYPLFCMIFLTIYATENVCKKYIYYRFLEYNIIMDWENREWYESYFVWYFLFSTGLIISGVHDDVSAVIILASQTMQLLIFIFNISGTEKRLVTVNKFIEPTFDLLDGDRALNRRVYINNYQTRLEALKSATVYLESEVAAQFTAYTKITNRIRFSIDDKKEARRQIHETFDFATIMSFDFKLEPFGNRRLHDCISAIFFKFLSGGSTTWAMLIMLKSKIMKEDRDKIFSRWIIRLFLMCYSSVVLVQAYGIFEVYLMKQENVDD
jgi:hypothetical protein